MRFQAWFSYRSRTAALAVVLVLPLSSCAFTLPLVPKSISSRKSVVQANGGDISEGHSVEVHRMLGITVAGSANYLSGSKMSPMKSPAPVVKDEAGRVFSFTPAEDLRIRVVDRGGCPLQRDVLDPLMESMGRIYAGPGRRILPARVNVVFVPKGMEVKREHFHIAPGKTATLEFWFPCDAAHREEYQADAILVSVHELTHATLQYFSAHTPADEEGAEAEYIADGASACLYENLTGDAGARVRALIDKSQFFSRDPVLNSSGREKSPVTLCATWAARMDALATGMRQGSSPQTTSKGR